MNKILIYHFIIKAISPLYFGSSESGKLLLDTEGRPIISGNAFGGALREYLKHTDLTDNTILNYLGGVDLKKKPDETDHGVKGKSKF